MIVRMLERSGLLSGHVELVQIRGRRETHDVIIKHRDNVGVPEHWSGYGFQWGLTN